MIEAINDLTKSSPETLSGIVSILLGVSLWTLIKNQQKTQIEMLKALSEHPEYTELAKRFDELRNDIDRVEAKVIEIETILRMKLNARID